MVPGCDQNFEIISQVPPIILRIGPSICTQTNSINRATGTNKMKDITRRGDLVTLVSRSHCPLNNEVNYFGNFTDLVRSKTKEFKALLFAEHVYI